MSAMKITGKLLEVKDTQQVSDTFRKRNFIVEYIENPQYPEFISFELTQDRCDLIDHFSVGQSLDVHFNLRGRKWVNPENETIYFNSLQAWRLEPAHSTEAAPSMQEAAAPAESAGTQEDDLPF